MAGYSMLLAKGRVQAGEFDQLFIPRASVNKRGVILCHAYTSPLEYVDPGVQKHSAILAAAIASAGFPCIAGDFGGDTLANDTVVSRISAAWAVLKAAVPGTKTDKMLLFGVSMGGGSSIRFGQTNPSLVAAFAGIIPFVDPNDVYVNNRASLQAPIGTAWGVTYPTPLPANALLSDPANMAKFTNQMVPQKIWYSSVDNTIVPAVIQAYAAGTGATIVVCDTVNGHGDATVGEVNPQDIIDFFNQYA